MIQLRHDRFDVLEFAGGEEHHTDVDWFSFPVTLKGWTFDFGDPKATSLVCMSHNQDVGGKGGDIYSALAIAEWVESSTASTERNVLATFPGLIA